MSAQIQEPNSLDISGLQNYIFNIGKFFDALQRNLSRVNSSADKPMSSDAVVALQGETGNLQVQLQSSLATNQVTQSDIDNAYASMTNHLNKLSGMLSGFDNQSIADTLKDVRESKSRVDAGMSDLPLTTIQNTGSQIVQANHESHKNRKPANSGGYNPLTSTVESTGPRPQLQQTPANSGGYNPLTSTVESTGPRPQLQQTPANSSGYNPLTSTVELASQNTSSQAPTPKPPKTSANQIVATDFLANGGTQSQLSAVQAVYASGDPQKIKAWEDFIGMQQPSQALVSATEASAFSPQAIVNSPALAGQSSFVKNSVLAEIKKGNKSSVSDLVKWFQAQEVKNSTTSTTEANAFSHDAIMNAALAGQSSYVRNKVLAAVQGGNKSSVGDLVNWYRAEEAARINPPISVPSPTNVPPIGGAIGGSIGTNRVM
jgi:hypothetical protein